MTVLLLANSAPEVLRWIKRIHNEISPGYETIIVSDSQFTNDILATEGLEANYCFSDFFRKHYNEKPDMQAFRKKFGDLNIWQSYYPDFERNELHYKYRYPKNGYQEKLLVALYKFFDEIITARSVKAIVYENVSNSFAFAAYNVAQLYNVKFFGLVMSRLPMRFELFDGRNINSQSYLDEYNNFLSGKIDHATQVEAEMYVKNFNRVVHITDPYSHPSISFSKRYLSKKRLDNFRIKLRSLKWSFKGEWKFAYQTQTPLFQSARNLIKFIKRKMRLWSVEKYYLPVNDKDKFFLYPLHLHPESTTSVQAPHYINELEVIQNIAINIPFGYYLYVKDHPSNVGNNNAAFYKRISRIPNVKLISYREDSKQLIPASQGVITLTSTLGFEALVLNKPVVALGEVFYEKHPLCFSASNYHDVWKLTREISKKPLSFISPTATAYGFFKITYKYTDEEVGEFVKFLLDRYRNSQHSRQIAAEIQKQ